MCLLSQKALTHFFLIGVICCPISDISIMKSFSGERIWPNLELEGSLLCWHDSEKRNENPPDIEFSPTLTFEVQRSEFQIIGHGFPFDSHQVLSLKLNQNQTLRKVKIRCINVHHCLLLLKDEVAFNFIYHSSILAGFVLFGNLYSCLHSL